MTILDSNGVYGADTNSPMLAPKGIVGRTDGVAPTAGYIGEEITNLSSLLASTTVNANVTVCSITLTPGVWDVYGNINFYVGSCTSLTRLLAWISTSTSETLTDAAVGQRGMQNTVPNVSTPYYYAGAFGPKRYLVAAGATLPVYILSSTIATTVSNNFYFSLKATRIA